MTTVETDLAAVNELVHIALSIICEGGHAYCERVIRDIDKAIARQPAATGDYLRATRDAIRQITDRKYGGQ